MLKKLIVIFSFFLILTSCATRVQIRVGDSVYNTTEDALKAVREENNRVVSMITPTKNPLEGRALCVLPSKTMIEKKAIKKNDPAKDTDAYAKHIQDFNDFTVSASELSLDAQAESLQRRQIFNELKIVKSENPETFTMPGYDFIIYYLIKAPNQAQWFLVFMNKESIPIHADMSLPVGAPRTMSWLNNIEKLAKEQRGK
ncbi:MAG: hypothetical protein ABIJ25_07535 [Pseudomonadota bacterium]